jgi:hypothetical protein
MRFIVAVEHVDTRLGQYWDFPNNWVLSKFAVKQFSRPHFGIKGYRFFLFHNTSPGTGDSADRPRRYFTPVEMQELSLQVLTDDWSAHFVLSTYRRIKVSCSA